MAYDEKFNNILAIWTAFGGRGNVTSAIPELGFIKKYYPDFGYAGVGGESAIRVHDNGSAQIAVYKAKSPYMAYYNHSAKKWTKVSVSWWSHGAPEILYAGGGVFIAKIEGLANIIASFDGVTWHNAGYCPNGKNAMICGAYDSTRGSGIVSFWYVNTPLYYSFDSLTQRTAWTLVGADGRSVPFFDDLITHKGSFIGIVGGGKSISRASTSSPGSWVTSLPESSQVTKYMYIRSVHDTLFVMKYKYANESYHVTLCVLNDSASTVYETNLSWLGDLADNRIASPQNIIWMEEWGQFILFNEKMLYVSSDGITWEGTPQKTLTTDRMTTFQGAIYVPGDGFYISTNDGYTYYGAY